MKTNFARMTMTNSSRFVDKSKRALSRLSRPALMLGVLLTICKAGIAFAGTISVTTTSNADSSNGQCSLVEAMKAVNGNGNYKDCHVSGSVPYTINIIPSGTITSSVALVPNKTLTIHGTGLTTTTIAFSANTTSGCGVVATASNLTLQNMTLQPNSSGLFLTGVCGPDDPSLGNPAITLEGVRIRSFTNRGVLLRSGDLAGHDITVQNNSTPGNGAGIAVLEGATLSIIRNISIVGNSASEGYGGGLFRLGGGNGNISNCTITGNYAGDGGGIYTDSNLPYLTLRFCTIASNSAWNVGGGIYVSGGGTPPTFNSSVIVSNTAPAGANFYDPLGLPNAANSENCLWGGPFDTSFNDINFGSSPNLTIQQATVSTEFSALSNTGSPYVLPIFPLRSTSSAVNLGACNTTFAPKDERGVARPQGPGCDSGAWER
jgi:hypothetical protein